MKIVYVGESPSRYINVPEGVIYAEHGVPVEVPDDLARSLLEQSVYEKPAAHHKKPASPGTKAPTPTTDDEEPDQ